MLLRSPLKVFVILFCCLFSAQIFAEALTMGSGLNKSGRQRMLTQNILKNYLALGLDVDVIRARKELDKSVALFEQQFQEVVEYSPSEQVAQSLSKVEDLWFEYRSLAISPVSKVAQIGILIRGVLNLLKIAYDEGYSEVSPGYLLIDNLITEPDDDHYISKISFVTGVDWIDRWKPQCESVRVAYTTQLAFVDHMLGRVIEKKAKVEINAQSAELEQ